MGTCASYQEAVNFETSAVHHARPAIDHDAFEQWVFDNADVNIRTLDDLGTFHAMGGVLCHPSCSSADPNRYSTLTSMKELAGIPVVECRGYTAKKGLMTVKVQALGDFPAEPNVLLSAELLDTLWLAGPTLELEETTPGWSGFMCRITSKQSYEVSAVLPQPFVNLPPSKPTTIHSCLLYAIENSRKRNSHCVVTFDNPLYTKAIDIVLSDPGGPLSSVTVRLGGFHLLMSYMGAIGKIMGGSGLKELWQTVYGKNTVTHMLSGHAYARAWRAYYSLTGAAAAGRLLGGPR